jgi:hypothetical protein
MASRNEYSLSGRAQSSSEIVDWRMGMIILTPSSAGHKYEPYMEAWHLLGGASMVIPEIFAVACLDETAGPSTRRIIGCADDPAPVGMTGFGWDERSGAPGLAGFARPGRDYSGCSFVTDR